MSELQATNYNSVKVNLSMFLVKHQDNGVIAIYIPNLGTGHM